MRTTHPPAGTCPNCGDPTMSHSWEDLVSCTEAQEVKRKKEKREEKPKRRFNARVG